MLAKLTEHAQTVDAINASAIATALLGDTVATNVFMMGFAWQKGLVPLKQASIMRAIEINGAAVNMNKAAFAWGRQAALDLKVVQAAAGMATRDNVVMLPTATPSLENLLSDRGTRLADYQDASYANQYEQFVRGIAATEHNHTQGDRFAREVGVSLYKLMAYKDEYEVARLYMESGFFDRIAKQFEPGYTLQFHLAPPLFSKRDNQGHLVKQPFGPWIIHAYRALAKLKFLRGGLFDVFGYSQERKDERQAIEQFKKSMLDVASKLTEANFATALEFARLPQKIRGFGHVKERHAREAQETETRLLASLQNQHTEVSMHVAEVSRTGTAG
jgi:indolepyruvate ferredoxin oxidoreductase